MHTLLAFRMPTHKVQPSLVTSHAVSRRARGARFCFRGFLRDMYPPAGTRESYRSRCFASRLDCKCSCCRYRYYMYSILAQTSSPPPPAQHTKLGSMTGTPRHVRSVTRIRRVQLAVYVLTAVDIKKHLYVACLYQR